MQVLDGILTHDGEIHSQALEPQKDKSFDTLDEDMRRKMDDPSLQIALTSNARYVGALGSRRTNAKRIQRLRQLGLTDAQLARLHAPIGLPLGGHSPGEIALSIMAEIVLVQHGGTGEPLSWQDNPLRTAKEAD